MAIDLDDALHTHYRGHQRSDPLMAGGQTRAGQDKINNA